MSREQDELEKVIGYEYKDRMLLTQAITHSSYSNEQKINKYGNYERLEFLGDAVLELISSEYLYKENKEMPEGKLSKLRASLVCETALAFCASKIHLSKYILLGKGEEITGGRNRESIISDVLEAIIGSLYLDGGLETAKNFVIKYVLDDIEHNQLFYDSKSALQEIVQTGEFSEMCYQVISENGPEHDKEFQVEVLLDGKVYGRGIGHSKKNAEQKAAYEALKVIKKVY